MTFPRVPCATFRGWMGIHGWLKTFTEAAIPGTYLKVERARRCLGGRRDVVSHRPAHDVTVALLFRAVTFEPS